MSEKHKEILKKGNAAMAEGNYDGFLSLCTEDTEWIFIGEQILKGKDAVHRWMLETYTEPPKVTIDNLIAEGDFLTAMGSVSVRDKEGKVTDNWYCDVWRFRDEKFAALKAFVIEKK